MDKLNEFADVFSSSDEYASRFAGKAGEWLLGRQSQILDYYFRQLKPDSILDVAGGHGQIANNFSDSYQITVSGSNAECSRQIKNKLQENKCIFKEGPVEKLNFEDNSFDIVTCIRYISHTDNWREVIIELCRVARKAVIIDYPPILSFNILTPALFKLKKGIEGNTRTYKVFSKYEIFSEFSRQQFKHFKSNAQFFFPMAIHRLFNNPALSKSLELLPGLLGLTDIFGSPVISCFIKE